MHEMSLALNILQIVEETTHKHAAVRATDIVIEVGSLAGVMISSLEFCLEIAKQDTVAKDADFRIKEIMARGKCPDCGKDVPVESFLSVCPHCAIGPLPLVAGQELRVREIEVERPD